MGAGPVGGDFGESKLKFRRWVLTLVFDRGKLLFNTLR